MPLDVLAGPGCAPAGKAQYFEKHRQSENDVLIDTGEIYRALAGRDDVPSRNPGILRMARSLRTLAIRFARRDGVNGLVTTSSGDRATLTRLAEETGGQVLVLDPGRNVMCRRISKLVPTSERRELCTLGLARWYDRYTPAPTDVEVSGG